MLIQIKEHWWKQESDYFQQHNLPKTSYAAFVEKSLAEKKSCFSTDFEKSNFSHNLRLLFFHPRMDDCVDKVGYADFVSKMGFFLKFTGQSY